jgi:RimJ/RimL family protein N-acetyltransferase
VSWGDLTVIGEWYNDPDIRKVSGMSLPFLTKDMEEFYEQTQDPSVRVWFMVETIDKETVIAETGFQRINPQWRTADLTLIVGSREHQGSGYGSEILDAILEYGFGVLNLHRVSVGIVEFNKPALALYSKKGFVEEGRQLDGYFWDHQYHDFVMMSLLETAYRERKRAS